MEDNTGPHCFVEAQMKRHRSKEPPPVFLIIYVHSTRRRGLAMTSRRYGAPPGAVTQSAKSVRENRVKRRQIPSALSSGTRSRRPEVDRWEPIHCVLSTATGEDLFVVLPVSTGDSGPQTCSIEKGGLPYRPRLWWTQKAEPIVRCDKNRTKGWFLFLSLFRFPVTVTISVVFR